MKSAAFFFLMIVSTGLLSGCQELTPLKPPTPSLSGVWMISAFDISELPAWYVAKTHVDSIVRSPTYTTYGDGHLSVSQNINSYTFTSGGSFSEFYIVNGGIPRLAKGQTDSGTYTLADSVLTLTVANNYPHKLTYRPATAQLVTEQFRQTAILEPHPDSFERDTVSYMIRLYYDRTP